MFSQRLLNKSKLIYAHHFYSFTTLERVPRERGFNVPKMFGDSCRLFHSVSEYSFKFLSRESCSTKVVKKTYFLKSLNRTSVLAVHTDLCSRCMHHSFSRSPAEVLSNQASLSTKITCKRHYSSENVDSKSVFLSLMEDSMKSDTVLQVEKFVIKFHDFSGLPWWASITLMTFTLRIFFTFPLTVYQNYILAKVENLTDEMHAIVNQLRKEANLAVVKLGVAPKQVQRMFKKSLKTQWNKLIVRDNCHPAKGTIVLASQIPLWILCSFALRNITSGFPPDDPSIFIAAMEMSVGGFLWCPNLLSPDRFYIIPVCLGVTNLLNLELQTLLKSRETTLQKVAKNLGRLLVVCTIPIAAQMPSIISLYWLCSSTFGLCQNLILLSPKVRKMVRIPKTSSSVEHPYRALNDKVFRKIKDGKLKLQNFLESKRN